MKRSLLAAAVATAPLLLIAAPVAAQLSITTSTTAPVATATAVSGGPGNIDVTSSGSITVAGAGAAVTLNSNNTVTNEGTIRFTDVDNATGIQVLGGVSGSVTNSGTINVTESYSPTDSNQDGLLDGNYASGGNRFGIAVIGPGAFNGGVSNFGAITIRGNASDGVLIGAPITGDFQSISLTAATPTTAATITSGAISVLGDNSVGFLVAPTTTTGGPVTIGGNVRLAGVTATGIGARGVVIDGAVSGNVEIAGVVTATGYRTTTRSSSPTLSALYTAQELSQGGPAVTIGGSVAGGVVVSAPPLVLSTTNLDQDGNGIPDSLQGTGQIASYGAAPALQIGASGLTANLGAGASGYGLLLQGTVVGSGLFDQITSPNLPGPVSANAIQIGAAGAVVNIAGGLRNTGSVQAQAYQANATGIHVQSGATVARIVNDGVIGASATQINSATTGVTPLGVNAILIDAGANLPTIVNNSGITANLTGSGGVGGSVGAIIDRSGSVSSVTNTGTITAELTQSLITSPIPGTLTAIDLSAGTAPQSLTQSVAALPPNATAYTATTSYAAGAIVTENGVVYQALGASGIGVDPASSSNLWRQIGAVTPAINGSLYFGSGGTTLTVNGGTIFGSVIDLGSGVNTLTVAGNATTIVSGSLKDEGSNTLTVNVQSGILSTTNPATIQANSVNVGSNGILLVSGDPAHPQTPKFVVTGSGANGSVFAQGAQVGLTLNTLQAASSETYIAVQTAGSGTLSAGTFGSGAISFAPFLYATQANYLPAALGQPAEITVTSTLKTQAQLGFNNAEQSALNAVLSAASASPGIQTALLAQTTPATFRAVYDQLLPPQGQGLFDALDRAAQSVSELTSTTPDAGTRVAGSSLWLQEVNERVRRAGVQTQGSFSKLFGIVGGYERLGSSGGAVGATLAYYNAEEAERAQQVGGHVAASLLEAGAYYRRALGGLTFALRGAGGYSWFTGERRFVAAGAAERADSSWNGYFVDGHISVAYEQKFGRFYARPEVSADYLRLHESGHSETGGDAGFDLTTASRTGSRLSGQAILVVGSQWGKAQWLRTEVRGGYREVFSGNIGDTVANFAGGSAFTLAPDRDTGGWATIGMSLKGGSQYSYLALEGDADFRSGEQRYDLRIAGRSIF